MTNVTRHILAVAAAAAIGSAAVPVLAQSRGAYPAGNAPAVSSQTGRVEQRAERNFSGHERDGNRRPDGDQMAKGRDGHGSPAGTRGDYRRGGHDQRGYAGYAGREGRGYPAAGHQGYRGYPAAPGYGRGFGAVGYPGWAGRGVYAPVVALPLPAYRGWGIGYGYGYVPVPVVVVAPAYRGWGYRGR